MIGAISGYNPYSTYAAYGAAYANRAAQARGAAQAQSAAQAQNADKARTAQHSGMVLTAQKAHQPDAPVQPVTPVRAINADEDPAQSGLLRFGSDPAEMSVRMRIQYPGDAQQGNAAEGVNADKAQQTNLPGAKDDGSAVGAANADKAQLPNLPGAKDDSNAAQAANADKADKTQMPDLPGAKDSGQADSAVGKSKSAQEVMEEGECQTCKERKYQDGSDDPGVSFKTPTNVAPEQAASAVRGHENEHVVREQAKAQREDRKVVSQSVTYQTDICPECGKVYVAGGETRTVTKAANSQQAEQQNQQQANQQDPRKPAFVGVA